MRPTLEDHGINLTGKWIGTFNGITAGGLDKRGAFDHCTLISKSTSPNSRLEGLTRVAGVRDGVNVNSFVGFQHIQSLHVSKRQTMAPHAILSHIHNTGIVRGKDFLTLSGAWANPYDIFAQEMLRREPSPKVVEEKGGTRRP